MNINKSPFSALMGNLENRAVMMKMAQALKLAQEGRTTEVFDSLSPAEKDKVKDYLVNMDPQQIAMISGKIREIASNLNAEQIADISSKLREFNPQLATKLEEVIK